jgi:hypothetical protein
MNIVVRIVVTGSVGLALDYAFYSANLFDVRWRMPAAMGLTFVIVGCIEAFWLMQRKRVVDRDLR